METWKPHSPFEYHCTIIGLYHTKGHVSSSSKFAVTNDNKYTNKNKQKQSNNNDTRTNTAFKQVQQFISA